MLRKFGKGLTAGVLIAAVGAVGLAASFVSKGTEKAQEVGATSNTITVNFNYTNWSWVDTDSKWVGIRAYNGTSWVYGSVYSSSDTATDSAYYSFPVAGSSGAATFTLSTTANITLIQFLGETAYSVPYKTGLTVGDTYSITVGTWSSSGYSVTVVDTSTTTTYSAVINLYAPQKLDGTYFYFSLWYSVAGVAEGDHVLSTATADSTYTDCGYVYSHTISNITSGSALVLTLSIVETSASDGTSYGTWTQVWNETDTISAATTVSLHSTDLTTAITTDYEKGLADTWAASFISGTASACTSLAMTSAIWSTYSTSYSAMSTDSTILAAAQADFKSATASASSTAVLAAAAARYDFIYNKYATSLSLTNFASRTTSSSALNVSGPLDNASSWTIGLIAGLGVILSGSYFFFLRKKKAE